MGIWGFSVLEVPDGDYRLLARLRPIVATRRHLLVADGPELVASGLPLLPTLDHPHWTVVLSEPSSAQFARVREIFRGPIDNPAWTGVTRRMEVMPTAHYDLWYDATGVDADLVVECWISHGPRAGDSTLDPQIGDHVIMGDDEEAPLSARVVRRQGDRVAVQVVLPDAMNAVA